MSKRISVPPETPEQSDQIVVLSEQSNHPPMRERCFDFPEGHWKWGQPEEDAVQVSLGPRAYRTVMQHARGDTRREVGGLLLGHVFGDEHSGIYQVAVYEALPDHRGVSRSATFAFTHQSWGILCDEAKERFPEYRIVGWYHSHPGFGVWYSGTDKDSHRTYFGKPWLVGLVVDPKRNEGAFFASDARGVNQLSGFYERLEDEGRFINWNNAIPRPHSERAAIPLRKPPRLSVPQGNQPGSKLSFRKRLAEDVPLYLAIPILLIFVLSLSTLFFSVLSYSKLDTRIMELEDRARAQEDLAPASLQTDPADTESAPFDSIESEPTSEMTSPALPPPVQESWPEAPPTPNSVRPFEYMIVEGDTLASLAQRYNVTVEAILDSNPQIQDPNQLIAGERILIPAGARQQP